MQICLSFYEVKSKQATWFTNKVERLHWEQWYINLNVAQLPKAHSGKSQHSKLVVDPGGISHQVLASVLNSWCYTVTQMNCNVHVILHFICLQKLHWKRETCDGQH